MWRTTFRCNVLIYTCNLYTHSVCTYSSSGTKTASHWAFNIQTGRHAVSHAAIDGRSLALVLCESGVGSLEAIKHHWHSNLIALTLQLSRDMWTTNRRWYRGGRACCCNKSVTLSRTWHAALRVMFRMRRRWGATAAEDSTAPQVVNRRRRP